MAYDPERHHRRTTRLQGCDYSHPGTYFITACTAGRACLFGEIINDEMLLSPAGQIVAEQWHRSADLRNEIRLDEFVVMPNHIHGIVGIVRMIEPFDVQRADCHPPLRRMPRSISSFVAGFKGAVTREINSHRAAPDGAVWQRGFHDHVIRDDRALALIRQYVAENPHRWAHDSENPAGDGTDRIDAFLAGIDAPPQSRINDPIDDFISSIDRWFGHST